MAVMMSTCSAWEGCKLISSLMMIVLHGQQNLTVTVLHFHCSIRTSTTNLAKTGQQACRTWVPPDGRTSLMILLLSLLLRQAEKSGNKDPLMKLPGIPSTTQA